MREALALAALVAVGCGDRRESSSAAPAGSPLPAAPQDARPAVPMPAMVPGSWPYVEYLSPCLVQLAAAPDDVRDRVRRTAMERLAMFGGVTNVELTPLGDRVSRADLRGANAPPRPPRSLAEARALAEGHLMLAADVMGLAPAELPAISFVKMVRVRGVPGVAWELFGQLERAPSTETMPVRSGADRVVVDLDARGAPVTIKVDWNLLPPVTLCDTELDRAEIVRAVDGQDVRWRDHFGERVESVLEAANIETIDRGVYVVGGSAYHANAVVGAVHAVHVRAANRPFIAYVDPATAEVVSIEQRFMH